MKLLAGTVTILALALGQPAFAACDQSGIGKAAPNTRAARLNMLKNRRAQPSAVRPLSVAEMLAYPHNYDAALEASDAVVLKGEFLGSHHEGAESPNCGLKTDYHIWIGPVDTGHPQGTRLTKAQVKSRKRRAVVVELTPNIEDLHPTWGAKLQRRLAAAL